MNNNIKKLWDFLYDGHHEEKLSELIEFLNKEKTFFDDVHEDPLWFKKGLIYSVYVDHFAGNFKNMISKLDYLKGLGVTAIWLLPVLESPMKDQGFDVSDYYKIRDDLGGNEQFAAFLEEAKKRDIKIIFDVAINHTSNEHEWFISASKDKNSNYRDYYIWNENEEKYKNTRIIFKGIMKSNWEYNNNTKDYFFHRFYDIQPDLNYKCPDVLLEMIKIFVYWRKKGVNGFRLDAVPYLWKEEGTNCENLPKTHNIIKIFRAALDYLKEGTVLIAEANQIPKDVVEYFGNSDECHTAYHFPVMPMIYLAIAENDGNHILKMLSENITPNIPNDCSWFVFLRCHDELTLEFVSEKDREKMIKYYLKDEKSLFREGEGIAGRLYDLMDKNVDKVLLAYSVMFSLPGTPINYYGDEIAMENDEKFYSESIKQTGYADSRFLNRGPFDEEKMNQAQNNDNSDSYKIFNELKKMMDFKNNYENIFIQNPELKFENGLLISTRKYEDKKVIIINNLANEERKFEDIILKPYKYELKVSMLEN
jgi:maltose alpha-D-glucosyltransferase/alpha-amylase